MARVGREDDKLREMQIGGIGRGWTKECGVIRK